MNFAYREVSQNMAMNANDKIIGVDTTNNLVSVTLPAISSVRAGFVAIIKDVGNYASKSGQRIYIWAKGDNTIDGLSAYVAIEINVNFASVSLVSDGVSKWHVY